MTFSIVCSVCGKVYQDWNGLMSDKEVERSYRNHLTGNHLLKGQAFQEAYRKGERHRDD